MQDDALKKFSLNLTKISGFLLQAHRALVKAQGQQSAMAVKSFQALAAVEALRDEMAGLIAGAIIKDDSENGLETDCSKWN